MAHCAPITRSKRGAMSKTIATVITSTGAIAVLGVFFWLSEKAPLAERPGSSSPPSHSTVQASAPHADLELRVTYSSSMMATCKVTLTLMNRGRLSAETVSGDIVALLDNGYREVSPYSFSHVAYGESADIDLAFRGSCETGREFELRGEMLCKIGRDYVSNCARMVKVWAGWPAKLRNAAR